MPLIVSFIAVGIAFGICEGVIRLCCRGDYQSHHGLSKVVIVVVSLVIGGLCIRLGYDLAYVGWLEWEGLQQYRVTYPVNGWIIMIGGGFCAIVQGLRGLFLIES